MAGTGGDERAGPGGPERREGWTDADRELERRLSSDEQRINRDEVRLAQDEQRIAEEERWIQRNWRLALALSVLLLLTIAALVSSAIALNRDIEAVAKAAPKDDSVGTAAIKDGAVTGAKLADGSVGPTAIARGAVTGTALAEGAVRTQAIASGAVTARAVARDGLTGATIDESTLSTVPRAARADVASDASSLAGLPAIRYLSRVTVVRSATRTSTLRAKGPVTADCPQGTAVVGGGAAADGARDVAITTSAPDGRAGWLAEAVAMGTARSPWRIVVTAICARGG